MTAGMLPIEVTALRAGLLALKSQAGWLQVRRQLVAEIARLADGVSSGILSPDQWQREMAELLIAGHLAAAEEGRGRELSPQQTRDVLKLVGEQVDFLNRFADQIEADGWSVAMEQRAQDYLGAMDASYSVGATGDLRLPARPKDGSTPCLFHCDCSWRIQWRDRARGDADAYWRLGATEQHCAACKRRSRDWAPLRIRGWEVQS